jgi:hypothetical protein
VRCAGREEGGYGCVWGDAIEVWIRWEYAGVIKSGVAPGIVASSDAFCAFAESLHKGCGMCGGVEREYTYRCKSPSLSRASGWQVYI